MMSLAGMGRLRAFISIWIGRLDMRRDMHLFSTRDIRRPRRRLGR